MKKRILSVFLSLLTILLILPTFHISAQAADYSDELRKQGFPESYISSLNKLKQAHPKWNFEVLKVNENFSTSVSQERKSHSQQLIQQYSANNGKGYYCSCSKCTSSGNPKVIEAPNWVSASKKAVEYYLDPRNFLDEQHIFQFESIFYNENQTQTGVESILDGTWMHNANIKYKDKSGNSKTYKKDSKTVKYSQAIMDAAEHSGLSAYYLASKIVQEVGGAKATAGGASGTYEGYKGIYNYYNIGAYSGAGDGLKWASFTPQGAHVQTPSGKAVNLRTSPVDGGIVASIPSGTSVKTYEYTKKQSDDYKWVKLTNVSVGVNTYTGYIRSDFFVESAKDTYNRPWTNPYLSIYNGAKWIANNFSKQYTGYLQKFNVNPASGDSMHSHEYMANVQAAANEAVKTYTAYKNAGALDDAITFSIPVFNDMTVLSLTAPTFNEATVNANGTFTLSWSSVSDADKYEIHQKQTDGSYKLAKTTTATSYTTVSKTKNKTYTYKIKAVNSTYNVSSSYSNAVSAKYSPKISETPTMEAVKINDNGTFTLSWSAISEADKYELYLLNKNGSYKLIETTDTTSFTTDVATYGETYTYTVRAIDSKNNTYSALSDTVSAINDKKMTTPTLNEITINSDGSFTLSWSAVAGADTYKIYIYNSSTGKYQLNGTVKKTSATTAYASYGAEFSYKVRAYDSNNKIYSSYSNVVSATNNVKLSAPKLNPVDVNTDGSFTLSWSAVYGADKYKIYIKQTDGSYKLSKTTTDTAWTTAVAAYGKKYSYKVKAVDSKNSSATSTASSAVSATNNIKLQTPTLKVTVNSNGTFKLSWNKIAGATTYKIYLKQSDGSYKLLKTTTDTAWTTAVAAYGKKYTYKIKAVTSKNSSATSAAGSAVSATNNIKLQTPIMKATANSDGTFKLSWNKIAGATAYKIYQKQADGSYKLLIKTTAASYTTSVVPKGKTYTYKVKAVTSKNSSATSAASKAVNAKRK